MAVVVIDALEVIHIDHQQAKRSSEPTSLLEPFVKLIIKEASVVDSSQTIN